MKKIMTLLAVVMMLSSCAELEKEPDIQVLGQVMAIQDDAVRENSSKVNQNEVQGAENSSSESLDSTSERIAESRAYAFDGCGPVENYESLSFFKHFIASLSHTSFYNPFWDENFFIEKEYISELCFSEAENILIGIDSGNYCNFNHLFKYDIDENILELADHDFSNKAGCQGSAHEFGKRQGNYILLQGGSGDGGAFFTIDYRYYFDTNLVVIERYCHNYVGGEEEFSQVADQCETYEI